MSKTDDFLHALRTDIVSKFCARTGESEAAAMSFAAEVLTAVHQRYRGEDMYLPVGRATDDEILKAFNGRNHAEVCAAFSIHRATLYRAIKRMAKQRSASAMETGDEH